MIFPANKSREIRSARRMKATLCAFFFGPHAEELITSLTRDGESSHWRGGAGRGGGRKSAKDRNAGEDRDGYVSLPCRQFRTVTSEIYGSISIPFRAAVCLLIGLENTRAG